MKLIADNLTMKHCIIPSSPPPSLFLFYIITKIVKVDPHLIILFLSFIGTSIKDRMTVKNVDHITFSSLSFSEFIFQDKPSFILG